MKKHLNFALTRPARKNGGDRYEADLAGEDRPVVIYIPQQISRANVGEPADIIAVTFEVG